MPVYEYYCPANNCHVEVTHGINERLTTWGELCEVASLYPGDTALDEPVERLLFPVGVSTPKTDSELKNMGFTKLVKRDTGVYENVTATHKEARYMKAGDSSTLPDIKSRITD